jgi:homoserine dehydrogenase
MQAAGITEADPALDVDGWDAAAKTAALVNVLMDGETTPHAVDRIGIAGLTRGEVQGALARGHRVKLIASAERHGGTITACVAPRAVPQDDVLATLSETANALVLRTDLLGEFAITQIDSGLTHTAYALVSDLVTLRRRVAVPGSPRGEPLHRTL